MPPTWPGPLVDANCGGSNKIYYTKGYEQMEPWSVDTRLSQPYDMPESVGTSKRPILSVTRPLSPEHYPP